MPHIWSQERPLGCTLESTASSNDASVSLSTTCCQPGTPRGAAQRQRASPFDARKKWANNKDSNSNQPTLWLTSESGLLVRIVVTHCNASATRPARGYTYGIGGYLTRKKKNRTPASVGAGALACIATTHAIKGRWQREGGPFFACPPK